MRVADVALLGPDDEERQQYLAGEPLAVRLRVVADRPVVAPLVRWEVRGESGLLLAAGLQHTDELGWDEGARELGARFDVERLPLAEGRYHLRVGLSDPEGGRLYHQLDDAVSFFVYSGGDERGLVRLEGRWSREEIGSAAELRSR